MNDLWGSPDSFFYNLLLLVHIFAIVTAFGPAIVTAMFNRVSLGEDASASLSAADLSAKVTDRYTLPSLFVALVAGILMVIGSGHVFAFEQTWLSATFAVLLALFAVLLLLIRPAQHSLLDSLRKSDLTAAKAATKRVAMGTGMYHLGALVIVALMIWKPGA